MTVTDKNLTHPGPRSSLHIPHSTFHIPHLSAFIFPIAYYTLKKEKKKGKLGAGSNSQLGQTRGPAPTELKTHDYSNFRLIFVGAFYGTDKRNINLMTPEYIRFPIAVVITNANDFPIYIDD
jgi:hypothetical protein